MHILVIDIGGSHIKLFATSHGEPRKFDSHPHMTPAELVAEVRALTADWKYEAAAVGYPGIVRAGHPAEEPGNLGNGWVGYDFEAGLGVPVRLINDAALQALGAYRDGRMLFLGLGTGLGSALVSERVLIPLELGELHFRAGTLASALAKEGFHKVGRDVWLEAVGAAASMLRKSFFASDVVFGGGLADQVTDMPEGCRIGGNEDAFTGGVRLWEETIEPFDRACSSTWRVIC
jgi:hypothetical protein